MVNTKIHSVDITITLLIIIITIIITLIIIIIIITIIINQAFRTLNHNGKKSHAIALIQEI